MKKLLLLFGIGILSIVGYGQTYNMSNAAVSTCAGTFYDSGGNASNYASSENFIKTFTPSTAGNMLQFVFTSFSVEGGTYDYLRVYDGPTTASPLIGTYTSNPGTITATNGTGQLTFWFVSDGSLTYSGWAATISCVAPPTTYDMTAGPSTINTCSGIFRDPGGAANYPQNATTYTQTFCSNSGNAIQFNFTTFATFEVNDNLKIYDGPNTGSTLIGTYSVASSPGIVTSSTGCLTFVWTTDNDNKLDVGWTANISCVPLPPSNDNPCGATVLTVNPTYTCTTVSPGTVVNATASAVAMGSCFGTADDDVWFKFVATMTSHRVSLLNVAGSVTDMYHSVYSGTCGALTNISCNDGDVTDLTGLTIGNTYWVRVYTYTATGGQTTTFNVCVGSPPPPPSNDEPCSATVLTVNPTYTCTTVSPGAVAGATPSAVAMGACFGTADDDVWFKFVATMTSHRVSLLNVAGSVTDMYHSIYSGTCGALTNISCNDGNTTNLTGLTIGNTYWVRVYTYTATGGQTTTFDVCVGSPPPPPSNDAPCNAILATVNADLLCGSVTAGYTSSATAGPAACVGSGADDDVWFKFVATSTVHNFDLLNVVGTVTDMVHEIFSGACGSLSSVACSDPNSSQFSGFTIGQTYYVRVYTYTSTTGQTVDFNLCIGTPPPPPSNDEPCGAIDLNVNNGFCAFQSAVLGTSSTISTGMPAPGCGSLGPDIWYKFTVPASGRIIIDMSPNGGPTDMDMAWYTSSTNNCNNLTTLVDCDDADSQNSSMAMICHAGASCVVPGDCQQLATLTPGTVVYVRLWEYGGTPFGPFDICAYDPGAPGAASDCPTATVIPSLPYSNAGQTTCCRGNNITMANANVCSSSYMDGEDFLYKYTPSANETIDITLTGTLSYTGLFVASKCPSAGGAGACIASATSFSGNPVLCGVSLTAGTTYYIMVDTDPTPTCTPFNINVSSSTTPSCGLNYTLASIGNAPDLNAGTNIALPIDDRFGSSYTPIGFTFCFDGYGFSQLLVSSNGYVIFDPIGCASNMPSGNAAPGNTSDWSISAAIPNTTDAPRNSILFPWQDINPALGGTIKYQTLGVAPNRRFVLTFDQIPYFDCTTKLFTGQLKLFETTNTIEVHITKNEICAGWNSGAAILGLHNFNGTVAVTPAGHNYPTNWAENNKGYRFTSNCVGCIILPVKLMSFTAKGETDYNLLNWMTATEINNDYFIVESSIDMVHFKEIGRVDGAGNSNNVLSYQFKDDNAPFEKIMYYRLKQVDYDGVYAYSEIVAVKKINEGNLSIYPNPAKELLFIDVNSFMDETYTINYINILGSIRKENIDVTEGTNTYQTNEFKNLTPGIYIIQIVDGNNQVIKYQKIVKE